MSETNKDILEFLDSLKEMDGFLEDDYQEMVQYLGGAEDLGIPKDYLQENEGEEEEKSGDIRKILGDLNLPGRLKAAMFGNAACRGILVLDGNRMIQMAVLKNPKLQEREIEAFTKNPNISRNVLRTIADNRQWMKPYTMKLNMVCNAKTPIDIAIKWLRFIHIADMKKIARSKNIPTAVVTQAKKRLEIAEKKKG